MRLTSPYPNMTTNKVQKYLDLFEYQKDEESTNPRFKEGFWSFNLTAIGSYSPLYRKMADLIHNSNLDEESSYNFTIEALQAIQAIGEVTAKHNLEDISQYSEPPMYNQELMEWLSKASNWSFVDETVEEMGYPNDGGILRLAQWTYARAWEQHYYAVLEAIK